ncbi:MAG TPA: tRNA dihydrouridine synthase DusB [Mycobacteriales bacterium]|nr:tRNA dihydrouridine synthase DusB [Mycobacteriales bacterium]
MALRIGPLAVDPPVVLAPMAGITNAAFRTLCREYGGGLYVSEMVSARALLESGSAQAAFGADEDVRSVQLYGVSPSVVAAAVRLMVGEWGVHHVDLNMGCPVPKVTRRGGGAALPVRVGAFTRVVAAAVDAAGDVPVTVKMRMGVDAATLTYLDAGRAAQDAGVAAVTLHARTAEQLYSGAAAWDAIAALKAALDVPVLGNGDVWTAADALRMVAATGCDGVVVGRGCLGRPWLFRDLSLAFAGEPVPPAPLLGEVRAAMLRHLALLAALKGEAVAVRELRRHARWYLTGYAVPDAVLPALRSAVSAADVVNALALADPAVAVAPGADALPRGVVDGPRRVALPDRWRETAHLTDPPLGADLVASGG